MGVAPNRPKEYFKGRNPELQAGDRVLESKFHRVGCKRRKRCRTAEHPVHKVRSDGRRAHTMNRMVAGLLGSAKVGEHSLFVVMVPAGPPEAVTSPGGFPSVVPAKAGTQGAFEGRRGVPATSTGFPLSRERRAPTFRIEALHECLSVYAPISKAAGC